MHRTSVVVTNNNIKLAVDSLMLHHGYEVELHNEALLVLCIGECY